VDRRSDNATSVDVEIDSHCRRLGRSQTDFALPAIVECRAAKATRKRVAVLLRWHADGGEVVCSSGHCRMPRYSDWCNRLWNLVTVTGATRLQAEADLRGRISLPSCRSWDPAGWGGCPAPAPAAAPPAGLRKLSLRSGPCIPGAPVIFFPPSSGVC